MKNLFISMGEKISVSNFIAGPLTYSELTASDVAALVQETRKADGKVLAYFEFGSVPAEKKNREFQELISAFKTITGVQLTAEDFTAKICQEGETLPYLNFIPTITDDMSMLAVEYFFIHRKEAENFPDSFEVYDDSMKFHFFEKSDRS